MRRLQLFEIEDQSWCPQSLRDALTDYLGFMLERFQPYAAAAPLVARVLDRLGESRVVDLCSGGGGPWTDLLRRLQAEGRPVRVRLTDFYPNRIAFTRLGARTRGALEAWDEPVHAAAVPPQLEGLRTLFTAFHHFPPQEARRILADAVRHRRGIAIFEASSRSPLAIAGMPLFALGVLLFTPFIQPFRWSRLLWTYVVPVLALVVCFDATVSCLRTYTPAELRQMVSDLGGDYYQWEIGQLRARPLVTPMTYLIGIPIERSTGAQVSAES